MKKNHKLDLTASLLLRMFIQKKEIDDSAFGSDALIKKNVLNNVLHPDKHRKKPHISMPQDFRPVSSVIDVDILPEVHPRRSEHGTLSK
jgi:partitioning defective protein 6